MKTTHPAAHPAITALPQRTARVAPWRRALCLLVAGCQALLPLSATANGPSAPIIPDASAALDKRPELRITAGPNAVPVIDIAKPTASGVSVNQFSAFNVPTQGLVLNNNAGAASVDTSLAGLLSSNTRLQGVPARVVLTEVLGNDPTQLLGTTEIGGTAARLVIANPHGVTCDGCGFLNTPHVQLVAGKPRFDDTSASFDMGGGGIHIGGKGLPALAYRLDLIARQIAVDGRIVGAAPSSELKIIATSNGQNISEDLKILASQGLYLGTSARDAGRLAISVGQSVEAGTIELIVHAQDMTQLAVKAPMTAAEDITISSRGSIHLDAPLKAGRDVLIGNRGGYFISEALISSGRDIQLLGWFILNELGSQNHMSLDAGRDILIGLENTDAPSNHAEALFSQVTAGRDLIAMGSYPASIRANGSVTAARDIWLNQGDMPLGAPLLGTPGAAGAERKYGPEEYNEPFKLIFDSPVFGNDLSVSAKGGINAGRDLFARDRGDGWMQSNIEAKNDVHLETRYLSDVSVKAGNNLFFKGRTNDGQLFAGNDIVIEAADTMSNFGSDEKSITNDGKASAGKNLRFVGPGSFLNHGELSAGQDITLGLSEIGNAVSIDPIEKFHNSGNVRAERDVTIHAKGTVSNSHTLSAGRNLMVTAGKITNASSIANVTRQPVDGEFANCTASVRNACEVIEERLIRKGRLEASGDIALGAVNAIDNNGADIIAGGDIYLGAPEILNQKRVLTASITISSTGGGGGSGSSSTRSPSTPYPIGEVQWTLQAGGKIVTGRELSFQPAPVPQTPAPTPAPVTTAEPPPSPMPPVPAPLPAPAVPAPAPVTAVPDASMPLPGSGSPPASPPAVSLPSLPPVPVVSGTSDRFVNEGNLIASSISINARDVVNGLGASNTSTLIQPPKPAPITVALAAPTARTGSVAVAPAAAGTGLPAGASASTAAGSVSGQTVLSLLPPALRSDLPLALGAQDERAALKAALLQNYGRAWIVDRPGDLVPGLDAEQAQHAALLATAAAYALQHQVPLGTALSEQQLDQVSAPMLWYVADKQGRLVPQVVIPRAMQTSLARVGGGMMQASDALVIDAQRFDNTGHVVSSGVLNVSADVLTNARRLADYELREYITQETRDQYIHGYSRLRGQAVQPGGFMQAALWDLQVDRIESTSGELRVAGASAEEQAAFLADLKAQLEDDYIGQALQNSEPVQDFVCLECRQKKRKKSFLKQLTSVVVAVVISSFVTPAIAAAIAGTGTATAAVGSAWAVGGAANSIAAYGASGALTSVTNQALLTGRVDLGAALQTGLSAGLSAGIGHAVSPNGALSTWGDGERWAINTLGQAAVGSLNGSGFGHSLAQQLINQGAASGAHRVGDGLFGAAGSVGHSLAHGMLGAVVAQTRGQDPWSAAVGALIESQTSGWLAGSFTDEASLRVATVTLSAALVTAAGGDAASAAAAAQNAFENNYLNHRQTEGFKLALQDCRGNVECVRNVTAVYRQTEQDQHQAIEACDSGKQCATLAQDARSGGSFTSAEIRSLCAGESSCQTFASELWRANTSDSIYGHQRATSVPVEIAAQRLIDAGMDPLTANLMASITPADMAGAVVGASSGVLGTKGGPAPNIAYEVRFGPTNPGPLPNTIANTFRGGSYAQTTLSEPITLYRVSGGNAGEMGQYWTTIRPSGPLQAQIDLALKPEWGNTATQITTIKVPGGQTIYHGAAASQGGAQIGGGSQVFIPRVDPSWVVR